MTWDICNMFIILQIYYWCKIVDAEITIDFPITMYSCFNILIYNVHVLYFYGGCALQV